MMSKTPKHGRTSTLFDPLAHRIGDLRRERAELEEEVLQLRAAVEIWTEVHRQTISIAADSDAEMR
jgi:hypothetical protein